MNLYEQLIGAPPSGPDETALTAKALRGQEQLGLLKMLTGDRVLSPIGQQMYGRSMDQATGLQRARQADEQRGMTQGYYDQLGTQYDRSQTETERRNLEDEAIRRDQLRIAEMTAQANAAKKAAGKAPTDQAQNLAGKVSTDFDALSSLTNQFKPEFTGGVAGLGVGGKAITAAGAREWAPQELQDRANWWARYEKLYELGKRNELFGSALTAMEIAAWEKANINANMSPEQVQDRMSIIEGIARRKLAESFLSHAQVYNSDWVNQVYGPYMEAIVEELGLRGAAPEPVAPTPSGVMPRGRRQRSAAPEIPEAAPATPEEPTGPWAKYRRGAP
jgi:hypothetical protein